MATFTAEQIARSALGGVSSNTDVRLAASWVTERLRALVAKGKFRSLRKLGELTIPAAIRDEGTVTVARGSTTVTGDADAQAEWLGKVLIGRHFRARTNWHEIVGQSATTLTLASEYAETDLTDGGYAIVKRLVPLSTSARWVTTMTCGRIYRPIDLVPAEFLEYAFPGRVFAGSSPDVAAEVGKDAETGAPLFEFYPYPAEDEMVSYTYYEFSPDMGFRGALPAGIDPEVLKEGILIDWYRLRMARAMDANPPQLEAAAFWRNQMNSQETRWDRAIDTALMTDHAVDDLQFITQCSGAVRASSGDIVTARDEIFARGRLA
jgi:hypothetical protein